MKMEPGKEAFYVVAPAQPGRVGVPDRIRLPTNTAMQCPACKTELRADSTHCHHCGRSLDKARMLDLFLDLGTAAALVAFSCVALLWMGF
jgi:hypothetical protein